MKKLIVFTLITFTAIGVFAEAKTSVSGVMEWDTMRIKAVITLDLASAGIKLPVGRTQAESILSADYFRLIRPAILGLQVDSSSTIADLVNKREFTLPEIEALAMSAHFIPPALSPDMRRMSSSYIMPISSVSTALLRHNRPSPVIKTLVPVSTARYTGIVIIATEKLPNYAMRSSALPVPCLFPKIWDSEMNLIYERSMLEHGMYSTRAPMVRYAPPKDIFQENPSGLTPELQEIAGERPLRIFASGVFGLTPTDLIIDRADALLIISSEENRRLLSEGRVVIVLDEGVLRREF
ncbi:MAG: polymerase [Treponema sp.]|jgi:hypothetical protein|nr:polymerase [Treponema sp.]